MTIPKTSRARPVRVPRDVYATALRHVDALGREIRMDSPATQGISTEWFTESALRDGELALAHRYADLEREDWQVVDRMFRQWLGDVLDYSARKIPSMSGIEHVLRVPRTRVWDALDLLATSALARLHESIDAADKDGFTRAQAALRDAHIAANDLYVEWIQDLLTNLARELGDAAVEEATRESYETVWRLRYAGWFDLTPHEKVALTCAGMRAHYGGPGRRGDFDVQERAEDFVLTFDPCGTGGVLRRRAADGGHRDVIAGNSQLQAWSWGLTDVPWYCSHCPILLEQFPLEDFGVVMRPTEFSPDPQDPTRWIIPKNQRVLKSPTN